MDEAKEGRRQLICVAASVWLPPIAQIVYRFLTGQRAFEWPVVVALAVPALLIIGLVRRHEWARLYTIVSLSFGGLASIASLALAGGSLGRAITVGFSALAWGGALAVLTRSKAIRAYQEYQDSLDDHGSARVAGTHGRPDNHEQF